MTRILFYAYCRGIFSSRKITISLYEDVPFIVLAGGNKPEFRTINKFRRRHIKTLPDIFLQILNICEKSGLVDLKHVCLDGTKINANASKHKAMSYNRMKTEEQRIEIEIKKLLEKANHLDQKEDKKYSNNCGNGIPEELAYQEIRLAKIKEAKAALEKEAQLAKEEDEKDKKDPPDIPPKARIKYVKTGEPHEKAQRNFTDPESMKNADKAFVQAYNSQAAVDSKTQIIVADEVTNQAADTKHLPYMLEKIKENIGRYPKELSAGAGYFSEANLEWLRYKTDAYIPGERVKHNDKPVSAPRGKIPVDLPLPKHMRRKLRTIIGNKIQIKKASSRTSIWSDKRSQGFSKISSSRPRISPRRMDAVMLNA